ncbi:hypothetical protein MY149_10765 [Acinetobacter indicus]|nr:hypothetical protein [Acinetobacter indicus]
MSDFIAVRKGRIGSELQNIMEWPTFDEGALEKEIYLEYINRKKGLICMQEGMMLN